jgi:hypothetical protein
MVYLPHMPCTTRFLPELAAVETVFAGLVDRHELTASVESTKRALVEHCPPRMHRLLCDCTALAGGHSLADLYFIADEFAASSFAASLREAVLVSPGGPPGHAAFWEDACRNRGLTVRVFDDRGLAESWLREQVDSH